MPPPPRVTECSSPLTRSLGGSSESSTLSSLRLLASNDSLLLGGGYEGLPGLLDASTLSGLATLTQCMEGALRHPHGRVVFAGCGTSGRLSQFHAHTLNACWRAGGGGGGESSRGDGPFSYILAGGDAALVLSQESAEDSPAAALSSLASWEASTGGERGTDGAPVVLLGITCGLSAPFVSTLVDAALDRQEGGGNWSVFALGFNPLGALEGASGLGAVHATWQRLVAAGRRADGGGGGVAVLINPCLGPESVAGSSRLKGGSATSMVVNATAFEALARARREGGIPAVKGKEAANASASASASVFNALLEYSATVSRTYHQLTRGGEGGGAAALLCDSAGESLRTPSPHSPTGFGRVVYLGVGSAGVLGLIDASECPPTYGSLFDDVRGYLVGGLSTLLPPHSLLSFPTLTIPPQLASRGGVGVGGVDMPPPSSPSIDLEGAFLATVLPTLSPLDTVILVGIEGCGSGGEWECAFQACAASAAKGAKVFHVTVGGAVDTPSPSPFHATLLSHLPLGGIHIPLPALGLPSQPPASLPYAPSLAFQALKLALNAITTLAHVHRGCVYQGRMIAMCISNCKLFHRGVGIVEEVGGVTPQRARACLVTAIHGKDVEKEEEGVGGWKGGVEGHVAKAVVSRDILPLAILLAKRSGLSVEEGRVALQKNTLVSKAIALV